MAALKEDTLKEDTLKEDTLKDLISHKDLINHPHSRRDMLRRGRPEVGG